MKRKILVSVTTITENGWKDKLKEIKKLKIKEIALFPTMLKIKDRKKLYQSLEEAGVISIPLVHAKTDFETWELDYLTKRFKTQAFNFHIWPGAKKFLEDNKKYRKRIFFENIHKIENKYGEIIKECGGVCLDVSHWQSIGVKLKEPTYKKFDKLLEQFSIGCNHISAVTKDLSLYVEKNTGKKTYSYDCHWLKDIKDVDYVKNYKKYLSNIVAIELENTIAEQLVVKNYIEKMLK